MVSPPELWYPTVLQPHEGHTPPFVKGSAHFINKIMGLRWDCLTIKKTDTFSDVLAENFKLPPPGVALQKLSSRVVVIDYHYEGYIF